MGDLQRALLVIISSIQSRTHFFAEQLQKAMKVRQPVLFFELIKYFIFNYSRVLVQKNQH